MSNQWMDYTTFFLAGALPPLAVLLGYGGMRFFKPKATQTERPVKPIDTGAGIIRSSRMNLRYFMALNVAVLLLAMAILLVPPVISMKQAEQASGRSFAPLIMILVVSAFALFGLVYAVTKGDLGWVRTYRSLDVKKDNA